VRWAGRDFVLSKWPRLKKFTGISRRRGFITVLLIRQLPITGFYINILLGLLPLTHLDFILGTAIGILPEAIPATLLGTNALHVSSERSVFYSLLVVAAFVIVWTASGRLLRASKLPEAEITIEPLPGINEE
ncbi:MAG: VTT domain-containing protein, partial [Pseudomonadota bacterium]